PSRVAADPRVLAMAPLFALILAALAAWAGLTATRALARSRAGPLWWAAFALLMASGTAAGVWCGFHCEYQVSDRLWVFSFPSPAGAFHLEEGEWVDYIAPHPLLVAWCNAATVGFASVLPLSVAHALWRNGTAARHPAPPADGAKGPAADEAKPRR